MGIIAEKQALWSSANALVNAKKKNLKSTVSVTTTTLRKQRRKALFLIIVSSKTSRKNLTGAT